MSLIEDFGGGTANSSTLNIMVPTVPEIPAGATLVIGAGGISTGNISVSDSKGNTWVLERQITLTSGGSELAQAHCVLDTPLVGLSDTITVNCSGFPTRLAAGVLAFDDTITSVDTGDANDNGGSPSSSLSAGTLDSDDSSALYVSSFLLVSSGRTFTAGAGWTAGEKYISTGDGGDRAVVMQWQYGSGEKEANASLNTGALWGGVGQAYGLDSLDPEPGPPIGGGVVIGGEIKAVVSESVVISGEKKPVVNKWVIINGEKKALPS